MRYRSILFAALGGLLLTLPGMTGCSSMKNAFNSATGTEPTPEMAATEHNPISIWNFRMAREYSAQGRYELAKEHYLLAYAAAGNDAMLRDALQQELHSIDLMIKTLR